MGLTRRGAMLEMAVPGTGTSGEVAKWLGNGLQNHHTPVRIRSSPLESRAHPKRAGGLSCSWRHSPSTRLLLIARMGKTERGPCRCARQREHPHGSRPPSAHLERFRPSPWVLALDAAHGEPRRRFRLREGPTSGFYDEVEGTLVALFRLGESLYFRAGDRAWALSTATTCEWSELPDGRKHFSLLIDGEAVFDLVYRVAASSLDRADPWFEEGRNDALRSAHQIIASPAQWAERFRDEQRAS